MTFMTTHHENPADTTGPHSPVLATAQELLATRMRVIGPLAESLAERSRLQGLVDANEKGYGAHYAEAVAAGWTPEELRQMGAEAPTRRPQGRPKGARTQRQKAKTTTPAPRTPEQTAQAAPPASPGA